MADEQKPPEKFSFTKWVSGFGSLVSNFKDLKTIVVILIVALLVYMTWFTFFRKPVTQTQHNDITNAAGGTINIVQKTETKKRAWWIPAVFAEPYVFTEFDTSDHSRTGWGGRAGLHWEW